MHAVIRMYAGTGAKQLVDLLETRKAEVTMLFWPSASVEGSHAQAVRYSYVRPAEGLCLRSR